MLYIVGINHGYQIVGKYPHALFDLPADIQVYQNPFFEWMKHFISQKKINVLFEEWPLMAESRSSAAIIAEDLGIQYVQIDELPQRDNQDARENEWVKKIKQNFFNAKIGLLIIGDNHCESVKNKLGFENIEIIRQREIEERLIPKVTTILF